MFSILSPLLRRPWFSVRMLTLFTVASNVNYFIILAPSSFTLYLLYIVYMSFSQVFMSYIVRLLDPICQILLAQMKVMGVRSACRQCSDVFSTDSVNLAVETFPS